MLYDDPDVRRQLQVFAGHDEDLFQELLVHLWRTEVEKPGQTRSWLLQSCWFRARHLMRSRKRAAIRAERIAEAAANRLSGESERGNLTNVTDALSHTVGYAYDSMNRLVARTDQLGRTEFYRYDRNGNVTNYVDRRGISLSLQYDAMDRRTNITYGTEGAVRLQYDLAGRLTNVADTVSGTIRLPYDTLDRLTQEVHPNGTVTYASNDAGLRTNLTVTGETAVTYRIEYGYWDDGSRYS